MAVTTVIFRKHDAGQIISSGNGTPDNNYLGSNGDKYTDESTGVEYLYANSKWNALVGGGVSKTKIQLLPSDANLTGSIYEPLFVGIQGTYINWDELRFDDTTSQSAKYTIPLASTTGYAGGQITCKIEWKTTAITGGVVWKISMLSRTTGDQIDTAYYSGATHSGTTTVTGSTELINTTTISFTPNAAELTAAKDCFIQLTRLTTDAGDTMVGDAKVITININED